VVLLLPWQLIVPDAQFAEAVQRAFPWRAGRLAAFIGAGAAREARKAFSDGAPCDPLAATAGDVIRVSAARASIKPRVSLFTTISFLD